jgi:Transglycosylase SLT domain
MIEIKPTRVAWTAVKTVASDIGDGVIAVTHNTLALIGFGVLLAVLLLASKPDTRQSAEQEVLSWLQSRLVSTAHAANDPALELALPATQAGLVLEAQMDDLPKQQKLVADWLSRRYRIAPDAMAHMVAAAYDTAGKLKLDPLLVLSVAAIESSFNPFVQSKVGAQGLMQVMSTLHEEKFERFGGTNAAFDPATSIKVGAVILKEYVNRAGSVEGGLKMYVGAANMDSDSGYGLRVTYERSKLTEVAAGKRVPVFFNPPTTVAVSHSADALANPALQTLAPADDASKAVQRMPVVERDAQAEPESKALTPKAELS